MKSEGIWEKVRRLLEFGTGGGDKPLRTDDGLVDIWHRIQR